MRILLDSAWLIHMMDKASTRPEGKILAMFDVIQDWLQAPRIESTKASADLLSSPPSRLLDFITEQAKRLHIQEPELFANQAMFMLFTALQSQDNATRTKHLNHAKTALDALMQAQRPVKHRRASWLLAGGMSIALCIGLYVGSQILRENNINATHTQPLNTTLNRATSSITTTEDPSKLSPMEISELLTKIEQMRRGSCRFIEAIQIPDKDKDTYINVVVNGQAPKNRVEMDTATSYLQKVQCTYTPMLMMNSK